MFVGLFVFTGASVAAWSVELPYYAFSAGPVGDAVDAIHVGGDVPVYQPDGELFMLTVSLQEVNAYEAVAAGLDPAVDLVRRQLIRSPEETDEQFKERTLDAMDVAKANAVAVALDRLEQRGFDPRSVSKGVRVADVVEGAPSAGILQTDDVLVEVDGVDVAVATDIRDVLADKSPGDVVTVVVERDGERMTFPITLGAAEDGRPIVGIFVGDIVPIDIESGNIGGPSAGMMYTLAIFDLLSEGDLTSGHVVAGTGTMSQDGTVGPIGGVRQKVVAAEAAGAEIMLVPEGNYEEALTAPRERMELVPVTTIDDALAYLEGLPPA